MYSHTISVPNGVFTGCKQIGVVFLRVQISDRFRQTTTLCFVVPLSQHNPHLTCELRTKDPGPARASITLSSLESVLKAVTAAGYVCLYIHQGPLRRLV